MVAMKILENLGWILTCTSGFAILIIFSAMAADVGLSNIFCWHPILLSMAFLLYMNEGLLVYFNNNNKTDRAVSRYWHGRYMLLATLFSIGGYIAIYISHARQNHSQFGIGHAFINALHVWIGYLVLLLMLLQSFVGMSKYFGFAKAKWHGKLGVYIYFGGILNICIAAIFWNSESWRGIVRFIVILTALSLALITLWIKRNGGILLSNDDEIDQENEYETVSLNDSTL